MYSLTSFAVRAPLVVGGFTPMVSIPEAMPSDMPAVECGYNAEDGGVVVIPGSSGGVVPTSSRSWHQDSPGIRGAAESNGRVDGALEGTFGASVGAP